MDGTPKSGFRDFVRPPGERRSPQRLAAHYEVEARLRRRLLAASRSERARVYSEVYSELFASVPDHPQHTADRSGRSRRVLAQTSMLLRLLKGERRYLEIGCGDAAVAFAMARHAGRAFGVDVTGELIDGARAPDNFRFLLTDGVHIPLGDAAADLVYSNQLMEHLHPDDATDQLREIARVLSPGGAYLCVTPSRFTGPHDISAYFGLEAAGFHLREYDHRSLRRLMLAAGFSSVRFVVGGPRLLPWPYPLAAMLEVLAERLAPAKRSAWARRLSPLFGLNAIARR